MSHIDITRPHKITLKKGKALLTKFADSLAQEYGGTYKETPEGLDFEGPGVSGVVTVDKTSIRIQVKLGLLMRPLKSVIEGQINEKIDQAIEQA